MLFLSDFPGWQVKRKKKIFAKERTSLSSPASLKSPERLEVERCRLSIPVSLAMLGVLVVCFCPPPVQVSSLLFPVLLGSVVGLAGNGLPLSCWVKLRQ